MKTRYPLPYSVPSLTVHGKYGFHVSWYYGPYLETKWFRIYVGSRVCYGDHESWGIVVRIP